MNVEERSWLLLRYYHLTGVEENKNKQNELPVDNNRFKYHVWWVTTSSKQVGSEMCVEGLTKVTSKWRRSAAFRDSIARTHETISKGTRVCISSENHKKGKTA
jgi:hypothetical protein